MHQQVLLLLDEFRDIVATSISDYDGSRGYSAVELRRHYNNMKIKLTHKGISRGRFVTVLKELGLSNDSDTLHAVVDEFDPVGVGYVTFELFSKVVKRDNDNDHFHQRHQEHLTYRLTRHRPQPSKRTEKEARSIVAKFQQHFHTRTSSIEQLHQVFDAFDRYGDGHIASNDFILAHVRMGISNKRGLRSNNHTEGLLGSDAVETLGLRKRERRHSTRRIGR
jgi:Ca2+-binding EF-hand superfamily protein